MADEPMPFVAYILDTVCLALLLGAEETIRAGHVWYGLGEFAVGIICGRFSRSWKWIQTRFVEWNPWERLRQANLRIAELTEQLAQTENEGASSSDPMLREVHTIRFEYLPISPFENGWTAAYDAADVIDFGVDPGLFASLQMKVAKPKVGIHYFLPPIATRADHFEFIARYSVTSVVYTRLIVQSRDGSTERRVDVAYRYGDLKAEPSFPNPNPGRNDAIWLPEQIVYWPAMECDDGCLIFRISLKKAVELSLGNQGWVFKSLEAIRLRGNLSISPIVFQVSWSRRS